MDLFTTHTTSTAEATQTVGRELAAYITQTTDSPRVMTLSGELGSGKTTLLQGFAQGLGITERIVSPTFILLKSYQAPNGVTLHHFDLYRLSTVSQLESLSFQELVNDPDAIIAIEWPERLGRSLPMATIEITCQSGDTSHQISIQLIHN